MQITKLSVALGYTLNLSNYESQRFDVSVEAEVSESESAPDCAELLRAHARSQLAALMSPALQDLHYQRVEEIGKRLAVNFDGGPVTVKE